MKANRLDTIKWWSKAPKDFASFWWYAIKVSIKERDWQYFKCHVKDARNFRYHFATPCLTRRQQKRIAEMLRDGTIPKFKMDPSLRLERR